MIKRIVRQGISVFAVVGTTLSFLSGSLPSLASELTPQLPVSKIPKELLSRVRAYLVISEKQDSTFETTFGKITVKRGSVVYATETLKSLVIYNLSADPEAVKLFLANDKPINIPEGEELLLTRMDAPFKDVKPFDAILYKNPKEIKVKEGVKAYRAEFLVGSAVVAIPPLAARFRSTNIDEQRIIAKILKVSPEKLVALAAHKNNPLSEESAGGSASDFVENLVVYESQEKTIATDYGELSCAPDSVVYCVQTAKSLAVYVLDEQKKGDVKISLAGKTLKIMPAQELVLTRQSKSEFKDVNPKTHILFRSARAEGVIGDVGVYRAEFMIERAVQQIGGLRKLSESSDPEQQKVLRRILKNAAILQPTAKLELQDIDRIATIRGAGLEVYQPATLQGKVEVEEAKEAGARIIDLTVTQSSAPVVEQDIHWLRETDNDWQASHSASLESGQIAAILNCSKELFAKTEMSLIHCKEGALVFVDNRDAYETVCNLDCRASKDVMVDLASGTSIRLPIGYALVLHKKGQTAIHPGPARLLSYRCWSEKKSTGNIDFMGAEFSLASAMYVIEPLRQMVSSSNPRERSKARSILKSAMILSQIAPGISYHKQ